MKGISMGRMIYDSLINGFLLIFKILWSTTEFKSAVIGVPVSIITFRIVGEVFRYGRANDIWFGSIGGKILYYLINTLLIWLVLKIT
ncbi:hypothetical protein KPL37_07075 [Clostridium frigoris]|uniref:Uncharacterized protein n=1 Tax=Clostridium frigoris TaxID=205327 RepID=A0ABS6BRV5_9CLOT|nr:hypothetical protein [Clostridium frigoris]MBU3159517.1 hypothetical protein [Clostridium frigoris]